MYLSYVLVVFQRHASPTWFGYESTDTGTGAVLGSEPVCKNKQKINTVNKDSIIYTQILKTLWVIFSPYRPDLESDIGSPQAGWSRKKPFHLLKSRGRTCRVRRGYDGWNSGKKKKKTGQWCRISVPYWRNVTKSGWMEKLPVLPDPRFLICSFWKVWDKLGCDLYSNTVGEKHFRKSYHSQTLP